jgi:Protein of unknown function (DUF1588)/Protein of unknown function (DUF1592)/Protein of unknown function (DUF1595)/Protein of unknown function (DUF1585)
MRDRRAWAFGCLLPLVLGCTGTADGPPVSAAAGAGGSSAAGGGSNGGTVTAASGWLPLTPCAPVLEQRVTRLSDRHLGNAVGELLGIPAPAIETGALSEDAFIPGKAAPVTGATASKLQDVAETAATLATTTGKPLATCTGNEQDCAKAFIDDFAARAFRRPLREQERTDLLSVYTAGQKGDGSYAGGISLVIETVLQSPSFLYLAELGTAAGAEFKLTGYETAAKLGVFLRDGLPDKALWQAAKSGALDSDAGISIEVDRLLGDPLVQQNLSNMFGRFFQFNLIPELDRPVPDWPALADAMHTEARTLVSSVLWQKTGTLSELLTSREATVTPALALLYGVTAPAGAATTPLLLPEAERAGVLTRAGLMAARAETATTSVVYRGLQVARGLLCVDTPPPPASISAQIQALKAEVLTERQRADKRRQTAPCNGCHTFFDPFGITFEHYDPIGKYRTAIKMPDGDVPVDSSQDIQIADIAGHFDNAVQLSAALAKSPAARECMSRQIASYAIGEKLTYEQACTVGALSKNFEASGGNLKILIKDVALWPALRTRKASAP